MKKGLTHIIFVVDRSGSMSGIASDMIGGYNTFIKKQKEVPGDCVVSFYQFDGVYEPVFERVKLAEVKDLDSKTYVPRNMTALYDAIGKTVKSYGEYLSSLKEDERPDRILFVTITDGMNNASNQFTLDQIRSMISHQRDNYKWDFVFLGSNIDAWDAGSSLGVSSSSTLQFANVKGSVGAAFSSLSKNARVYRCSAAPTAYSFDSEDYDDQLSFLDDTAKAKSNAMKKNLPTKTQVTPKDKQTKKK